MKQLPDFIIIGAGKCGTTSLYDYLDRHPQVYICPQKETYYFVPEPVRSKLKRWGAIADPEAYYSLFKDAPADSVIGEISTNYHAYSQSARLIHQELPEVKIIAILRNPADRAFSNYQMFIRNGNEKKDFATIIQERNNQYIKRGFYYSQLLPFYQIFPAEKIKILLFDDLCSQPVDFIQNLFEFIGVAKNFVPDMNKKKREGGLPKNSTVNTLLTKNNPLRTTAASILRFFLPLEKRQNLRSKLVKQNTYKAKLSQTEREQLIAIYQDDIVKLEQLIERDLSSWRQ